MLTQAGVRSGCGGYLLVAMPSRRSIAALAANASLPHLIPALSVATGDFMDSLNTTVALAMVN
jgi:hypothetical protein